MHNRDKRGNGPLYMTCAGILAFLLATWIVNQQKLNNMPPQDQAAQGSGQN